MPTSRKAVPLLGLAALAALGLGALDPAHAGNTFTFSVGSNNFTNQVEAFTFSFTDPASAPVGSLLTLLLSGTVTTPAGGGSVGLNGQPFLFDGLVNDTDTGFGAGTSEIFGPAAGTYTYGPPSGFTGSGLTTVPVTDFGGQLSFLLSPNSSATFNGTVTLSSPAPTSAPEPSSVVPFALGGLGLVGLILRTRKRPATETG